MEEQIIIHQDQKYRIAFKRSDTKGIDGFTVEANGDDLDAVKLDASNLYEYAKSNAAVPKEEHE